MNYYERNTSKNKKDYETAEIFPLYLYKTE